MRHAQLVQAAQLLLQRRLRSVVVGVTEDKDPEMKVKDVTPASMISMQKMRSMRVLRT